MRLLVPLARSHRGLLLWAGPLRPGALPCRGGCGDAVVCGLLVAAAAQVGRHHLQGSFLSAPITKSKCFFVLSVSFSLTEGSKGIALSRLISAILVLIEGLGSWLVVRD